MEVDVLGSIAQEFMRQVFGPHVGALGIDEVFALAQSMWTRCVPWQTLLTREYPAPGR